MKTPIIIAEACCNHMGDVDVAKQMIIQAKQCGANYIKFQKRSIDTWAEHNPIIYKAAHPNPNNSFGNTYEEHRRFLEFSIDIHKDLKALCDSIGINYACSTFDITSAKEIIDLAPSFIKIPSACNTNFELLKFICDNFDGDIHLSFGMTPKTIIDEIVNFFVQRKKAKSLVVYACTSAYPLPLSETCLLEIKYLLEKYSDIVNDIGYSGHHEGIVIDIAAYVLGAKYIERHFTLDRQFKGTDQKMSITPNELKELISNLNDVVECLKYKSDGVISSEIDNMEKLKW